jgi:hypothetical protein
VNRALVVVAAVVASACAQPFTSREGRVNTGADTLYWKAIATINPANAQGSLDGGIALLDQYLASRAPLRHGNEALVIRRLAQEALQLARVEAALHQARSDSADTKVRTEVTVKRDEAAIKEIQRLKEELSKANEELERIRKRLANPPKPPG